jgi:pilus assembly protein FimV
MGILDEAIREHLELKRQHGVGDSELKQLEDEAFGQAERPGDEQAADPLAEAPTEFMTQPEAAEGEGSRREPTIADLQEPPPPPAPEEPAVEEEAAAPVEEEQPAMEHEIVADPVEAAAPDAEPEPAEPEPAGHSTEEREAIAEQPTEMFDVEEELSGPPSPTDEEIVEEEIAEPRLAPTDPLAGLEETEEAEVSVQGPAPDDDDEDDDEDDAFWNEQRLSDELDQALEAPRDPEPELEAEPEFEDEPEAEVPEAVEEPEPVAEAEAPRRDEDVLEETPDFLEETPEDDQLWFEQKPPKDFDFDD